MMIEKIVALYDFHVPYNVDIKPIVDFIHDFKPNKIILGGDVHDFEAVSNWVADQSRHLDGGIIKENFAEMIDEVLDPLAEAKPKGCKMIYLKGNHEARLDYAMSINPNGRGYWDLEKNLDLKGYNMEVIPANVPYKACDNLYLLHGLYTNDHHTKKTAMAFAGTSVLYGHTHDRQEHTVVSPLTARPYKAASLGCLCSRNPLFLRNRPNRWVNGFSYIFVNTDNQHFWDTFVHIIGGEFFANGSRYR